MSENHYYEIRMDNISDRWVLGIKQRGKRIRIMLHAPQDFLCNWLPFYVCLEELWQFLCGQNLVQFTAFLTFLASENMQNECRLALKLMYETIWNNNGLFDHHYYRLNLRTTFSDTLKNCFYQKN